MGVSNAVDATVSKLCFIGEQTIAMQVLILDSSSWKLSLILNISSHIAIIKLVDKMHI